MTFQNPDLNQTAAQELAHAWVTRFADAIASANPARVADLFHPDGFWRDCVATSRSIKTVETADQIAAFAKTIQPQNRPRNIRILPGVKQQYGFVTGEFEFRTEVFRGTAWFQLSDDRCRVLTSFAEHLIAPARTRDAPDTDVDTIVIGAGHAGLSLAAWLQHLGIDAEVFDAQDRPGDAWRNRYDSLRLHEPTAINNLPFRLFPKDWPTLAAKDMLADFLTEYAQELNLNVTPRTRLTGAEYENGVWTLELLTGGETRRRTCSNLVLATGQFGRPRLPVFDGMERFEGSIRHAAQYRNGAEYSGQNVVVIGAGNTSFDVCLDLAQHGAKVTLLQRSPVSLISQQAFSDMLFGAYPGGVGRASQPNAVERAVHAMPTRLYLKAAAVAWKSICETDKDLHTRLRQAGLMLDDGVEGTGVLGQYKLGGTGLVVDQGTGEWIADGRIAVQTGAVNQIEPTGLRLENGDRIAADAIICATGYQQYNEGLQDLLGPEIAADIGPVWGPGYGTSRDPGPWTGEHRNVWTPTAMPGLWIHGGSLGVSRFYSHLLALQIAARRGVG